MNAQTQILNASSAKLVRKSCYKCGYIRETSDRKCIKCGKLLETVTRIKITGAIQIILGGVLLAVMGWLAFWMLNANSNSHFHGDAYEILFIIFVFGLIVSISLGVIIAGIWQIIFGKRNKLLMFAIIGLGIAFLATGFAIV
ncbi:MAG: hypothetical protein ABI891_09240, partial [Acidobacteriota bacterium]